LAAEAEAGGWDLAEGMVSAVSLRCVHQSVAPPASKTSLPNIIPPVFQEPLVAKRIRWAKQCLANSAATRAEKVIPPNRAVTLLNEWKFTVTWMVRTSIAPHKFADPNGQAFFDNILVLLGPLLFKKTAVPHTLILSHAMAPSLLKTSRIGDLLSNTMPSKRMR